MLQRLVFTSLFGSFCLFNNSFWIELVCLWVWTRLIGLIFLEASIGSFDCRSIDYDIRLYFFDRYITIIRKVFS